MNEKPTRTISGTEFQRNIGATQSDVAFRKDHIVVAIHGRPMMVLVPAEDYDELQALRREAIWMRLTKLNDAPKETAAT